MTRNFGLGHYRNLRRTPSRPGDVFSCPSPNWPALGAGLFYSREASLKGQHHAFGKAERPTGQVVAVKILINGNRIWLNHAPTMHVGGKNTYTNEGSLS